jgi:PST family polysaccharide transporter
VSAPAEDADAAAARLDPAEVASIRRRARLGAYILGARTVLLQLVVFGGAVMLARLLTPAEFGAFAIVQFALSFFTFFGDCGVGGALVRQKHAPTDRELASVFYFQLAVGAGLFAVIFGAASLLGRLWPTLPEAAPWVMRALAVDVLLVALRIVPAILMERDLAFGRIAALEVVLQISFYATAVPLAWLGLGLWALTLGVVSQGVLGVLGAHLLRPYRPKRMFDWPTLRPIVRFGVVYQLKNAISFFNGAVTPLYAGTMLGAHSVGLVNWARETAWFPLRLVEILARVNYPVYARLQDDRAVFTSTLERSIHVCAVFTLFCVGFFCGLGPSVVSVLYTDKWAEALPFLYVLAGSIVVGFLSPILGAALDASGRPGIIARLALGWTALNWAVVVVTTPLWGTMGFVAGFVVHVVVGNVAVVVAMRRLFPEVRVVRPIAAAALPALAVGLFGRLVLLPWTTSLPRFVAAVAASALVFLAVLALVDRAGIRALVGLARRPAEDPTPAHSP